VRVEDLDVPSPAPGEIVVRLRCAALNRRDLYITEGRYPAIELPCTLGSDGCGEVAAIGSGAAGPPPGTPVVIDPTIGWGPDPRVWTRAGGVLGMPRDGTFAEYVSVPAANVHPKPAGLSASEAAAIGLAGLTAYRAVFTRGGLARGETVLITGIGGGVQSFVLAFAKHAGARTIVTSSSDEKLERARELGADVTVNYRTTPDWHREVRRAADGGPDLVIDSAGGETLARALEVAKYGGRVVIYGGTAGEATIRPYAIFWKQLDVLGTSMGSPGDFRGMLELFEHGLRPVVDSTYPLDEAGSALRRLAGGEQFGKILLAIA
jgi:NADPH:quinone reductase-like Zn-dependent oxidoreductase